MKYLAIFVLATIGSGCATTVDAPIGLPGRPHLPDVPDYELVNLDTVPAEVIEYLSEHPGTVLIELENLYLPIHVCSDRDLALKEYARKLEKRIAIHDESI